MIKTLTTHGNSAALIIDKPILELLNIDLNTPLEIKTDGRSLIITPIYENVEKKNFKEALEKVNKKHGTTLKKLAE